MRKLGLVEVIFIGLIYFFTGCIAENMDGCFDEPPPLEDGSLTLLFTYSTKSGDDEFLQRVNLVNLVIFSDDGTYLEDHTFNDSYLRQFQGTTLDLDPGIYNVICWGNLTSSNSLLTLDQNTNLNSALLYLNSESTADPIYYAPRKSNISDITLYQIEVPEKGEEEKVIDFMTAYYTVNVYVTGFERIDNIYPLPIIEMQNIPESYNFHLAFGNYTATLRQQSTLGTVSGKEVGQTSFHTTHFEVQNAINVNVVKPSDQEVAYTVNLQEILVANNYILTMGEHVTIDVYIEFKSNGLVDVTLKAPGWGGTVVEPGYE